MHMEKYINFQISIFSRYVRMLSFISEAILEFCIYGTYIMHYIIWNFVSYL